ncbi:MAG: VUT family protein [Clostridia bacterium]|nr:VUT family protein [Clostridia bacterium]
MTKLKTLFSDLFYELKLLQRSVPSAILALFVTSVVSMNLLANKSIDLNLDWLALDCGLIFSWVAFLTMDVVTKRFGVRAANMLSIIALLINLLASVLFIAAAYIPGTWSQSYVDGSEAIINFALDGTFKSAWYVIMGSSIAFIVSAFLNNFLNFAIGKLFKKKNFLAFSVSSYASTFIGQFVDNLLFALIVSLNFFGWSILQCVTCALTGAVAELLAEVVFSPVGYRVVKKMETDGVGQAYVDYMQEKKEKKICRS